jgi:hypothetical protein
MPVQNEKFVDDTFSVVGLARVACRVVRIVRDDDVEGPACRGVPKGLDVGWVVLLAHDLDARFDPRVVWGPELQSDVRVAHRCG